MKYDYEVFEKQQLPSTFTVKIREADDIFGLATKLIFTEEMMKSEDFLVLIHDREFVLFSELKEKDAPVDMAFLHQIYAEMAQEFQKAKQIL